MVNRLADKILNAVLPHTKAAAACHRQVKPCYCSGGLRYGRVCYWCDGSSQVCGQCHTVIGSC